MSVNEVKLKQAVEPFVVRGTGPPNSRTFCIGDEDHTIGNATRHVLMQDARVRFAGYSVPHPSEPMMHVRIQCNDETLAIDALVDSCQTLHAQCDIVRQRLEQILPEVKEDRLKVEKFQLEEGYRNDEDYDEEYDEEFMRQERRINRNSNQACLQTGYKSNNKF